MKTNNIVGAALLALALGATAGFADAATVIKIATVAPDGTAWMKEMRAAADAVKTKTGDRVELKYYPGGVMGDDATVLRKIKIGQLQGAAFTGGQAASITPDASVYSQPFSFRTLDEVDKVRAQLDPQVKQSFEKAGFYAPGISGGGFAYLMSVREIHGKDAMKSAKVWVPQGDHIAEIAFKAAGVTPIPLPLADVYTSLETGLIDTVANTTSGAIAFQWHTKVKYVLDLPLTYVVGILVVDKKAVDALGADDQKVLNDEIGAAFARLDKITRDDNAQARDALQKQGVKIAAPTAAEAKEWDETGVEARKEIAAGGGISPALAAAFDKALAAARAK
jgi:TRAP-type C4-dicarboxylate transport system substrate-binding protein